MCRLNVQCDADDGRDDEVVFQFTADKLLSANDEVRNLFYICSLFSVSEYLPLYVFLQVKPSYYTRCCINMNNSTEMKLTFDLTTHPPFSCDLEGTSPMTLFPGHSAQVW